MPVPGLQQFVEVKAKIVGAVHDLHSRKFLSIESVFLAPLIPFLPLIS